MRLLYRSITYHTEYPILKLFFWVFRTFFELFSGLELATCLACTDHPYVITQLFEGLRPPVDTHLHPPSTRITQLCESPADADLHPPSTHITAVCWPCRHHPPPLKTVLSMDCQVTTKNISRRDSNSGYQLQRLV